MAYFGRPCACLLVHILNPLRAPALFGAVTRSSPCYVSPVPKFRATVLVGDEIQRRKSAGRRKLWAYGYATLARLLGMTETAVRTAVTRGRFNPASLESVLLYQKARRDRRTR